MEVGENMKLGLPEGITIILAVLKLGGAIDIDWIWVFAPVPVAYLSVFIVFFFLAYFGLISRPKGDDDE